VEASPFYRGGKAVRGGGGRQVIEVKYRSLMVLKDRRRRPEGVNGSQSKFLCKNCVIPGL
jgi:hypothetical protein